MQSTSGKNTNGKIAGFGYVQDVWEVTLWQCMDTSSSGSRQPILLHRNLRSSSRSVNGILSFALSPRAPVFPLMAMDASCWAAHQHHRCSLPLQHSTKLGRFVGLYKPLGVDLDQNSWEILLRKWGRRWERHIERCTLM